MGVKIMVKIQGNLYDLWEVRSIEKVERWNDEAGEDGEGAMEYLIIMNKRSIGLNFTEVIFAYDTAEARDEELKQLALKLEEYETIVII